MAKRARGSVRPGQRRRIDRRAASLSATTPASPATATPAATPKPAGLSDAELERAAQIEADLLAEEKAAEQARKRTRERTATRDVVRTGGSLSAQEAAEYAYVARDVKDIVKIASLLLGILIVLWLLIDVTGVIPLGG
jgi:membrane-bound ClpP family serine protease